MSFGGAVKLTGESEYRQALRQITQNLKELSSEMKIVSATYDKNDKSSEALSARAAALNKIYAEQSKKLSVLKEEYSKMSDKVAEQTNKHKDLLSSYEREKAKLDELGRTVGNTSKEYKDQEAKVRALASEVEKSTRANEYNEKTMSNMRIEINKTEAACASTAREMDDLGKETEESGKQAQNAGNGGFTILKGVIANLASEAISKALEGLKKLGTELVNVGKQAYNSYSEYEQLTGGVETLFGDAAGDVKKYADEAYKTAGISANKYMEQATSFAATLLQGLEGDTKAAAKYTDLAIKDMSDNANKMGTDISMIQNAYQSMAKQNFTLLDNLKLGYGGSATEAARLVNETKVLGEGVEVTAQTVKEVPFNKIIEAIHIVQQNLGITGTTAEEAAGTIEGSSKAVSASWQNLMTAIADENADLQGKLKIFSDNVVTYAQNAVPRIKQIVKGLGDAIVTLLKQYAPNFSKEVLPVIKGIADAFKAFAKFVIDNGKTIISVLAGIAAGFAAFKIASTISSLISTFKTLFATLKAGQGIMAALNATMSVNPWVLLAAAIGGVVTSLIVFNATSDETDKEISETKKELNELKDALDEDKKAWDDAKTAQQKYVDKGLSEMKFYETLAEELKTIVDENGKVKKGYEERASFIVDTLKDALGIEIELQDGVILGYQKMQNEIDKLIAKKKAQIILDSQEDSYKLALEGQTEATRKLIEAEGTLAKTREEAQDYERKLRADAASKSLDDFVGGSVSKQKAYENYITQIEKQIAEKWAEYYDAAGIVSGYQKQLEEYAYYIGVYEHNIAALHAENYEDMINTTWNYISEFDDAADAEKAMLEDQYNTTKRHYELLKELQKESNSDMYDAQIAADEKQLKELEAKMDKMKLETEKGLELTTYTWSENLDEQLSVLTGRKVEFAEAGEGMVQMFLGGVSVGAPKTKEAMGQIVNDVIHELGKGQADAIVTGQNFVKGLKIGLEDKDAQFDVFSQARSFGTRVINALKQALGEKSPSVLTRQMGQYLLEGFDLGIQKEEKGVLGHLKSFGRAAVEAMKVEARLPAISSAYPARLNVRNTSARGTGETEKAESAVSALETALSRMKIVLDDEVAGHFVEETVSRIVYA